ncbi:MAG: D-tyrosyl-tRNA(Tyr) deacylase [Burkholderiales bacterium PBB6]|nr:MAG: D-tyrosyl-tRNA(Tyr) deacylase [Burkholderiales bacterium PBB6]
MIALIQRVRRAHVDVAGQTIGAIGPGMLVLVCAEPDDTPAHGQRLLDKLLKLRIFSDDAGKMNRPLTDLDGQGTVGGLLLVSQFTLAANTAGGNRPSFTAAAPPALGRTLYDDLVQRARASHPDVATGEFGADMQVHLVNDGPVTIPMRITA